MSKFFSGKYKGLTPYVPGEQPQNKQFIKLNTNESPFPPSPMVLGAVNGAVEKLRLYPEPNNRLLERAFADYFDVLEENVFVGNGSDEVLAFIFQAFFDKENKVAFPDITYGFYPVYSQLFDVGAIEIPLKNDFTVDLSAFKKTSRAVVLANPNAPTGIAISAKEVEKLVASNAQRLVVIDEAYVDFGGESVVGLIKKYDNLIVVQTLSKSHALAGGRVGVALANAELIKDIKAIKFSFNSYNVDRLSEAAAIAALADKEYFKRCCNNIADVREYVSAELKALGFKVLPSSANFVFAKVDGVSGEELYEKLRAEGILVRRFEKPRIKDFLRITIGTREQMTILLVKLKAILNK